MIVDFSIFPIGVGESLSTYVAEVFKIIEERGLPYEHHAMGTNIEGDWDAVMRLIKTCRDRMFEKANTSRSRSRSMTAWASPTASPAR